MILMTQEARTTYRNVADDCYTGEEKRRETYRDKQRETK